MNRAAAAGPIAAARACVFDAYGTLFDVHSAVDRSRERLGAKADAVSRLWRAKQLEYTWLRSLMGRHADFWQVTREALDYALDAHGVADDALSGDLMQAYLSLSAYPEAMEVLERVKAGGLATAVLSNGAPTMLDSAVASAGIGAHLDAVLSVEAVGIYKPDPRVYRLATDVLGVEPRHIVFVSANAWDAAGAAAAGLTVAWCNRFGQRRERLPGEPHFQIRDLREVLVLLGLA